jgi:hypothetical protein
MPHNSGMQNPVSAHSRRAFMRTAISAGAVAASTFPLRSFAQSLGASSFSTTPELSSRVVRPALLRAALAALDRHGDRIALHDRIAIADFAAPSVMPRFHLVDLASRETVTMRVAHGRGSDPAHTGWLQHFSNDAGSYASCDGAFLAADYYIGKHGRSQRLIGLDPTNDNALDRAIVIHSAWYAEPEVAAAHGQLGRSEGCFAVAQADLERIFALLGPGRMLFAAKA